MLAMSYMDVFFAMLAAATSASVVYIGSAATRPRGVTTLDIEMAVMSGVFTFASMLVAQHPEWVA